MRHAILAAYDCEMVNAGEKTGVMRGQKPRERRPRGCPPVLHERGHPVAPEVIGHTGIGAKTAPLEGKLASENGSEKRAIPRPEEAL